MTKKEREELSALFGKPMLLLAGLSGSYEEMGSVKDQILQNLPPEMAQSGKDIFEILAMLPAESRMQMMDEMGEKLKTMPDSMVSQAAVLVVKGEYAACGIDTDRLQSNYVLLSGGKMLLIALLSMLATILVGFLASRVAAALGRELRGRVFRKVVSFSNAEFDKFSTA